MVVRSTDPRAVRKQTIGRGLIALVWAIADVGQVALAWNSGTGDRPGDAPLFAFAASAAAGAVLLGALVVVNVRAVRAVGDAARLLSRARVIAWLCGLRLVVAAIVLFAVRGDTGPDTAITQVTFQALVIFVVADAGVALVIATSSVAGLRRLAQPGPPPR
jgi:hypothetical protein